MHHSTARRWQEPRKPFRAQARRTPSPCRPPASDRASGRKETPPPCRRQGSIFPPPGSHAPRCDPASRAARCEEASAPPFRGLFAILPERIPARRKAVRPFRFFRLAPVKEAERQRQYRKPFIEPAAQNLVPLLPVRHTPASFPHFLQYSMNGFRTKKKLPNLREKRTMQRAPSVLDQIYDKMPVDWRNSTNIMTELLM